MRAGREKERLIVSSKLTATQLDRTIDNIVQSVVEQFQKLQSCHPHYFLVAYTGDAILYLPESLATEKLKDRTVRRVIEMARECSALAIVFATEAWMVQAKSGKRLDTSIQPSRHPDRVEILSVSVETFQGTTVHIWPILRGKRVTLGTKQTFTQAKGRFCDLLVNPAERN
ncbi:MAG: hypothetical protein HJJLKODD_02996 [Phycisphaerae bacterium]|nr:hypothetical protein [Phycisphaerae bacterium]